MLISIREPISGSHPVNAHFRHQRGTALLTVLFILVLLTTLVAFTASDENLAIRQLTNQREYAQSLQVAQGGEMWAMRELERDMIAATAGTDYDYPGELWARLHEAGAVKVEDGDMYVEVQDLGGRFNLNNLLQGKIVPGSGSGSGSGSAPDSGSLGGSSGSGLSFTGGGGARDGNWYLLFTRLLTLPSIDMDPNDANELADALVDWLDEDSKPTDPGGAEDDYYQSFEIPYRTANRQLSSVSELSLVKGFSPELVKRLKPLVTALPIKEKPPSSPGGKPGYDFTRINANTAPKEVLQSLTKVPADAFVVDSIVTSRMVDPFRDSNVVGNSLGASADDQALIGAMVDVKSDFFIVLSCAQYGRVDITLESMIQRDRGNDEARIIGRQRRYGCERTKEGEDASAS